MKSLVSYLAKRTLDHTISVNENYHKQQVKVSIFEIIHMLVTRTGVSLTDLMAQGSVLQ